MKKLFSVIVCGMLAAGLAWGQDDMLHHFPGGPWDFRGPVNMLGGWSISGTKVTATAANLNAGLASSTASLVSNAVCVIYGSNITTVANGATSLGGTLAVTGVATFTAKPVFTVTNVVGAVTGTLTNLPTSASTVPAWLKITVGSVNYAVPMYALP